MKPAPANTAVARIDIEDLLSKAESLSEYEYAENTKKAYRSALRGWTKFCDGAGFDAEEPTVASAGLYFTHMSETLERKSSTIDLHRAALKDVFKHTELGGVFVDPRIGSITKSIRRKRGVVRKQKDSVTIEEIKKAATLPEDHKIIDVRDRAVILLGFAGAFRVSELSALRVDDLAFDARGVRVTIERSKTDQEGQGKVIGILRGETEFCPVRAVQDWIEQSGIVTGPLFRGWLPQAMKTYELKHLRDTPLSTDRLREIVKERFQKSGLSTNNISFHTLRISLVTHAKSVLKKTSTEVMGTTRHGTEAMIIHYTNVADAYERGVGLIGL